MRKLQRVLGFLSVVALGAAGFAQTAPAVNQAPAPAAVAAKAPLSADQQLAALQKKMQDWAQLGYYRERNAGLVAAAAGEQRVVFYGDSITELWGRSWKESFGDKPYVDRGISGQTSAQMVVRFHQDVVDLHPKVVVILAGTNDVAANTGPMTEEATLDDFRSMAEMARANGIKVVVGAIPPAIDFPWRKGMEPAPKIRSLNAKLEAWCKAEGVVWVDYYSALSDADGGMKPGLSLDGVHPTPAGFAVMTPLAEAGIAKALGK